MQHLLLFLTTTILLFFLFNIGMIKSSEQLERIIALFRNKVFLFEKLEA